MKKKVVLISGSLKLSGSATWILNLHSGFKQLDTDVIHIITSDDSLHNIPDNFLVFYTGAIDKTLLVRVLRAVRLHKWARQAYTRVIDRLYDRAVSRILQESGLWNNINLVVKDFTAYIPPLLNQYPVVATIHQQLSVNWHNPNLREKALQSVRHFVSVSEAVKQDAEALGIRVTSAIYNPIDIESVKYKSTEYSVDLSNFIVFVGSLNANKGVFQLLDAFSSLDKSLKLCFVGSGKDEARLKSKAVELGVSERVVFTGFVSNPYPWIRAARILVLPTQSDTMGESMGYVTVEASILGTPILVSDFNGVHEFYEDDAIIAQEPRSQFVEHLAERLNFVLANGQEPAFKESVLQQMNPAVAAQNFLNLVD